MKRKALLIVSVILLLSMSLISSVAAQDEPVDNIVDIVSQSSNLETLYDAIIAAGLADTLASADNEFTLFAPTDAAFAAVEAANPGTLEAVLADPEGALTTILTYHVVPGTVMSGDVAAADTLTTAQGENLTITTRDGQVFVNGNRVVTADIEAKNGVIHIINGVLLPEAITGTTEAETAAPTTGASAAAQADRVDIADADLGDTSNMTIAAIATQAGSFTQLLSALQATGLAQTFALPGNYTVFAPTDAAFDALGDVDLSQDELERILLHHVVGDELTRDQLATDDIIPTLADDAPLFVNRDGSMIVDISGAKVLVYNIPASNGIIHVIDRVLIP